MELKNSLEFIYENCANRIKEQKNKLDITALEIYPSDDKMISKITNNKRTKNNRFLVTDRVLEYYSRDNKEIYGIVSKLNFNSKSEVLWGDKEEIKKYLPELFSMIFDDLLENFDKNELEKFFLDYVPYAKYAALNKLLEGKEMAEKEKRKKVTETNREMKLFSFMMAYGISEDDVIVKYYNYYENKEEIIDYLFLICYKNFLDIFLKFIDNTDSFHKIDKKFSDFVYGSFIPMLKKTTDEKISLGKRVYNLVLNDISMSEKLLSNENICNFATNLMRNRIRVSSRYITELEILQKSEIEMLRLKE